MKKMVRNGLAHNGGGGGGTNFLDHLFFVYGCVSPFKHTEILWVVPMNTFSPSTQQEERKNHKENKKQKRQQNKKDSKTKNKKKGEWTTKVG